MTHAAQLRCCCGAPIAGQGSACRGFLCRQHEAVLKPP